MTPSIASAAALALPETAIRYDANGAGVRVVGADNRVKHVAVQTGQRIGAVVVVRGETAQLCSPLKADDLDLNSHLMLL